MDGKYRHKAIFVLTEPESSWAKFRWTAILAKPGLSAEVYKQMAGLRNTRHSLNFQVKFTFGDILFNLRVEYDPLKLNRGKISASMDVAAFVSLQMPWLFFYEANCANHPETAVISDQFGKK